MNRFRTVLRLSAGLLLVPLAGFGILAVRHHRGIQNAEAEWQESRGTRIENLGAVQSLSILPLVNWHVGEVGGDQLRGEVGVSYLIQTEDKRILFDLGQNAKQERPSPLEYNMERLNIARESIDAIFISHAHFDHVGGRRWSGAGTFSTGTIQPALNGKRVFTPVPMTYPGIKPEHTPRPRTLFRGLATTGTIPRQLLIGRIDEQALVINVAGKGLVLIVGCGHQTQRKIIERVESVFSEKIYGIIGDLHYPVPDGRIKILGLNAQRLFASGSGPLNPLRDADVDEDIERLRQRSPGIVALGGHDSSDESIQRFAAAFGERYRHVRVGEWIRVQ